MAVLKSTAPRSRPSYKFTLWMNASLEEKSVWIQLISLVVGLGLYFIVVGSMLCEGVDDVSGDVMRPGWRSEMLNSVLPGPYPAASSDQTASSFPLGSAK
jgi:hypothetical protein